MSAACASGRRAAFRSRATRWSTARRRGAKAKRKRRSFERTRVRPSARAALPALPAPGGAGLPPPAPRGAGARAAPPPLPRPPQPAKGIQHPALPGFNASVQGYSYEPARAKQLFAECGFTGTIRLLVGGRVARSATAHDDAVAARLRSTLSARVGWGRWWGGETPCGPKRSCSARRWSFRSSTIEASGRTVKPIRRLLIANRGEIAGRIIRACRALGIARVYVFAPDQNISVQILDLNVMKYSRADAPAES